MMNRIARPVLGVACAFLLASPLAAQSSMPQSSTDWSGGYYGIQLGFPLESSLTFRTAPGVEGEFEGIIGGGQIGFRRQIDAIVYGAEIELIVGEQAITEPGSPDIDVRTTTSRIGAQAGYSVGAVLPYATVGIGRMTFQDTDGFGDTASFGVFGGIGAEVQLSPVVSVAVEMVRETFTNFNEGNDLEVDHTNLSVQLNLSF